MSEGPGVASKAGAVSPDLLHCLKGPVGPFCHGYRLGAAGAAMHCLELRLHQFQRMLSLCGACLCTDGTLLMQR